MFEADAQSPWKAVESGDVVHFFYFDGSNKIARYDLVGGTWLSTLVPTPPVGSSMTAGWVDDDGLYLAFGKTLRRYTRAGTGETHLRNTAFPILEIISDDDYIIVASGQSYDDYFFSIRKTDNSVVADSDVGYSRGVGLSIDPVGRVIYGRTTGVSPSDILRLPYQANGTFGMWDDSPHHGDYPSASKTYLFPGGERVVDGSGTIYQSSTLDYMGSLTGSFDDLKFLNGTCPIVLRGNTISAYSSSLLETGSKTLSKTCHTIALRPNHVIAFYPEPLAPSGISTISTALSELNPGTSGPGVDPVGALYTPDSVFMGNDGMVHLFSKKHQSIFRWNPLTASYGATIPLVKIPVHVTYNPTLNRIYTGSSNGEVRLIDLAAGSTSDVPFLNLATGVQGLASAGEFLFAEDSSGAWESQFVISQTGAVVSSDEWRNHSNVYEWSPANSAMYQFRDGSTPNDLIRTPISSQGIIGTEMDSPYHGGVGTLAPIRVSPDGEIVVLGSGEVFDGTTLQRELDNLPTAFVDGNWRSDGSFVTIRDVGSQVLVERYSANFGVIDSATFPGTSHRILPLTLERVLVITLENSIPKFRLLDAGLSLINGPIGPNPPGVPQNPNVTNLTSNSVTINWTDADDQETGFVIERKGTGSQAVWSTVGTVGANVTSFTNSGLGPSTGYYFRVAAFNADGSSGFTNNVFVSTPVAVPQAPASLSKTGATTTSLTLAWSTVVGATGYKIEQLVGPSTWSAIQTVGSGTSTSTISGLASGVSYTFRVRAYNSGGDSLPSSELSATTDSLPLQDGSFYRITFEEAKHVIGQGPAVGGSDSPSLIVSGTPQVVDFDGSKVLRFNAPITAGTSSTEKIRLNLDRNVPTYILEYDIFLDNLVPSPLAAGEYFKTSLGDLLDQSFFFQPFDTGQDLRYFQSSSTDPSLSGRVGNYVLDKWYHVKIEVDTVQRTWRISLDGNEVLQGPLYINNDINYIDLTLLDREGGGDANIYLDNITVSESGASGGYDGDFPVQPASPSDLSLFFDVDWDQAPHVVGQQTAVGAPTGPSGIHFGSPKVAASFLGLDQRPLVLESGESFNHYEQISFSLRKGKEIYAASFDLVVSGHGPATPNDGFALYFDGGTANSLDFNPNGQLRFTSQGAVGNYVIGQPFNLRVLIDVPAARIYFSVDGGAFVSKTITIPDGDLFTIRPSLIDSSDGDGSVGIDNVRIMGFDRGVVAPAVPAAPTIRPVSGVTSNRLRVNWTDNDSLETGFSIERQSSGTGWVEVATVPANTQSYLDENLEISKAYSYRVIAFNTVGDSIPSASVAGTTAARITPPAGFTLSSRTESSLSVLWSASTRAIGYRIEIGVPGGLWETFLEVSGGGVTSAVLNGLQANQNYLFRVTARGDGEQDSIPSAILSASTAPVSPPTGVTASDGLFDDKIVVAWAPVSGALTYEVFRNSSATGVGATSLGPVSTNSFEDLSPEAGTIYFYAVKATTANGTSALSVWNSGNTVLPKPGAPDILIASTGSHVDRVVLSWNAGTHATSYNVYRSASSGSFGSFLGTTSSTTFADSLALPGQHYHYRVSSRNSSGVSDAAGPVLGYARLGQVAGLRVSYHRSDGVLISWDGVVGANAYSVLRNTANDPQNATLITITSAFEFLDSSAMVDENYYYFVRAENGSIFGSPTNGEEGIRLAAPGYLADLLSGERPGALAGDNHYGTLRSTRISRKRRPVSWISRIQNDGLLEDDLTFSGQKGDRKFKVNYFGPQGNVTAGVVSNGLRFDDLETGSTGEIRTIVSPSAKLRGKRAQKVISGGVTSGGDRTSRDGSVTVVQVK